MGLTPNRSKGRNLEVVRSSDTVVKLDELETAEKSVRKRKNKKGQCHGTDPSRLNYSPVTRDSISMYSMTNDVLDDDDDEDDDKVPADMSPFDDSDDEQDTLRTVKIRT